ncbi:MAG: HlyD family secretion protein [Gemmatimonadetes bacterium]|nr:HlyD family secretion protein [Gemmatimonadota bacterium]
MATVVDRAERDRPVGIEPAEAARPKARRRIGPIVLGVLALVGAGLGVRHWLFARNHVTTDNAQVEGHITPVLARVGAYVAEVRVEDNQEVKAGDTLVVLDDRDLRARLAQADADLAALKAAVGAEGRTGQAVAQLAAARAAASAAQAAVEQARINAERAAADLQRYRALAEKAIISRQQLDAAQAAADAAQAQLLAAQRNAQAAQDQVASASAGLLAADAKVAAAEAARDQVLLQLSYTRITAPSDGLVAKKSVEVGQLVQPGQPLMSVVPLNDVWVVANLKETQVERVRPGDPVDIEVDAYPGHTFKGKVESVSPATGAKFSLLPPDNATGNFTKVVQRIPVRIQVDGRQDPARPLRPGMSAVVTIETH